MPTSIGQTLEVLVEWYEEPETSDDRAQLLSKMAVLELCGWLEGTFDELILQADARTLMDSEWVRKSVLARVHGFDYDKHLRPMLRDLLGEVVVRRVEGGVTASAPGDLDRLKSVLGSLWKTRCDFAHADVVTNIQKQQTFNAPSWSRSQFEALSALIDLYVLHLEREVDRLAASSPQEAVPSLVES